MAAILGGVVGQNFPLAGFFIRFFTMLGLVFDITHLARKGEGWLLEAVQGHHLGYAAACAKQGLVGPGRGLWNFHTIPLQNAKSVDFPPK